LSLCYRGHFLWLTEINQIEKNASMVAVLLHYYCRISVFLSLHSYYLLVIILSSPVRKSFNSQVKSIIRSARWHKLIQQLLTIENIILLNLPIVIIDRHNAMVTIKDSTIYSRGSDVKRYQTNAIYILTENKCR